MNESFEQAETENPKNPSITREPSAGSSRESLLSRREVAKRWQCCIHTIARRRDLEPVRLGRRLLRYRLQDIEAIERAAKA